MTKNTKYDGIITENVGGFGSATASVQLHFAVEVRHLGANSCTLHAFHGSPAYSDWWTSGSHKIASDLSLVQAKELIDRLCGREGAHQFFDQVNRNGYRQRLTPIAKPLTIEWPYGFCEKFDGTPEEAEKKIIDSADNGVHIKMENTEFGCKYSEWRLGPDGYEWHHLGAILKGEDMGRVWQLVS